jgi:hypothetical protein
VNDELQNYVEGTRRDVVKILCKEPYHHVIRLEQEYSVVHMLFSLWKDM